MNLAPVKLRIVVVIQARMSSDRLPGKVLRLIKGKPLLGYLLERLKCCEAIDDIVLATSVGKEDDPLVNFAKESNISCCRGSLPDVAGRLLAAAEAADADCFVRISGDSPLLDNRLVDKAAKLFRTNPDCDLVTNVENRTYPKGQSVEIISTKTMREIYIAGLNAFECEHVTPHFYTNSEKFRIINFENRTSDGEMQVSVDTEQDLEVFEKIINVLGEPFANHDLRSIVDAARKVQATK